jgi:hypothetical protein
MSLEISHLTENETAGCQIVIVSEGRREQRSTHNYAGTGKIWENRYNGLTHLKEKRSK